MFGAAANEGNILSKLLPPVHALSNNGYVFLFYSYSMVFPVSYLFKNASLAEISAAILTQFIFTITYLHSFWIRSSWLLVHFTIIASMSLIWANINIISIIYYFYCPYIILYSSLKHSKTPFLVFITAISTAQLYYHVSDISGALLFFTLMCVNIFAEHYRLKQQLNNHKLHLNNEEIEQLTRYAERSKIARDLHDALGQKLVTHILKMELAKEKYQDSKVSITESDLASWINSARDIMGTARSVAHRIYDCGIEHECQEIKEDLGNLGIEVSLSIDAQQLKPKIENLLLMIIKECVSNIVNHANANKVSITILIENQSHIMTVQDNGIGFHSEEGFGMIGIRERVKKMRGYVDFSNQNGMLVRVMIPTKVSSSNER